MKRTLTVPLLCFALLLITFTGCEPKPKLAGRWRYEAPTLAYSIGGIGGITVIERIALKLSPDGTVDLNWTAGRTDIEILQGDWKLHDNLLVMTRTNKSFLVFKVGQFQPTEFSILTKDGIPYRLSKIPDF